MNQYGATAKTFHWLMFLLIAAAFGLAWTFGDMHLSPLKLKLINWHKWVGVTIFLLVWLRLGWRLLHAPPPMPAMPAWQKRAAEVTHRMLYLFMIAQPVTGWLMSSAKGVTTVYFGLWPLPDLLAKDKALGAALAEVHGTLAWIILGFIALHVLAALKHLFIDRDGVMMRMLP
ncbi:MAG TPA: cytochrome b [Stenotrophobium sp.]|jgi:cytochrome b561|nr:cytochrome b [Stenotrophobium sp.]